MASSSSSIFVNWDHIQLEKKGSQVKQPSAPIEDIQKTRRQRNVHALAALKRRRDEHKRRPSLAAVTYDGKEARANAASFNMKVQTYSKYVCVGEQLLEPIYGLYAALPWHEIITPVSQVRNMECVSLLTTNFMSVSHWEVEMHATDHLNAYHLRSCPTVVDTRPLQRYKVDRLILYAAVMGFHTRWKYHVQERAFDLQRCFHMAQSIVDDILVFGSHTTTCEMFGPCFQQGLRLDPNVNAKLNSHVYDRHVSACRCTSDGPQANALFDAFPELHTMMMESETPSTRTTLNTEIRPLFSSDSKVATTTTESATAAATTTTTAAVYTPGLPNGWMRLFHDKSPALVMDSSAWNLPPLHVTVAECTSGTLVAPTAEAESGIRSMIWDRVFNLMDRIRLRKMSMDHRLCRYRRSVDNAAKRGDLKIDIDAHDEIHSYIVLPRFVCLTHDDVRHQHKKAKNDVDIYTFLKDPFTMHDDSTKLTPPSARTFCPKIPSSSSSSSTASVTDDVFNNMTELEQSTHHRYPTTIRGIQPIVVLPPPTTPQTLLPFEDVIRSRSSQSTTTLFTTGAVSSLGTITTRLAVSTASTVASSSSSSSSSGSFVMKPKKSSTVFTFGQPISSPPLSLSVAAPVARVVVDQRKRKGIVDENPMIRPSFQSKRICGVTTDLYETSAPSAIIEPLSFSSSPTSSLSSSSPTLQEEFDPSIINHLDHQYVCDGCQLIQECRKTIYHPFYWSLPSTNRVFRFAGFETSSTSSLSSSTSSFISAAATIYLDDVVMKLDSVTGESVIDYEALSTHSPQPKYLALLECNYCIHDSSSLDYLSSSSSSSSSPSSSFDSSHHPVRLGLYLDSKWVDLKLF